MIERIGGKIYYIGDTPMYYIMQESKSNFILCYEITTMRANDIYIYI